MTSDKDRDKDRDNDRLPLDRSFLVARNRRPGLRFQTTITGRTDEE